MASLTEFDFIDRFLKQQAAQGQPLLAHPASLGIGDDAALIPPLAAGEQLAVTSDMLVEGRHYWPHVDPAALGHKVLAVNLSDLAAMGAQPLAFTLSAGLSRIDDAWLTAFLQGLFALARQHQCALVGGDTVGIPSGAPAVFSVTAWGSVPVGQALRRSGLQGGDDVWVSGHLGDPAYAVSERRCDLKLDRPEPRLQLGVALRGVAHAAIDVSDGLHADLGHMLRASCTASGQSLCAEMDSSTLPLGPVLQKAVADQRLTAKEALLFAGNGGDDYELCFGAAAHHRETIEKLAHDLGCELTRIGKITEATQAATCAQVVWRDRKGEVDTAWSARLERRSYDHFKGS